MKILLASSFCELYRESGDPKLYSERAVSRFMLKLLRDKGWDARRVRGPQGLTACPTASIIRLHDDGSTLWHERYAVELSHEAYNRGSVVFQRVA